MSASSPSSTPVKRACDSCHRRKVKCIGEGLNPCKNCVAANLQCTYNAIPQKKGPKGSRAKVLTELRETQRQQFSAFSPVDGRGVSYARNPALLPPGLVESCIDFYVATVHQTQPILSQQSLQAIFTSLDHSTEAYCLVTALCANVMIEANMNVAPDLLAPIGMARSSSTGVGQQLLYESIRVRKGYDYFESPSQLSIITSYLYYGCFLCLNKDKMAWTYLREASTQALLLGMQNEDTYKDDPLDISRRRVLYWLLLMAERTQALHKHRPISLFATISVPTLNQESPLRQTYMSFTTLCELYRPFDERFFAHWNKVRTGCDAAWLAQMQDRLSQPLSPYLEPTESQEVYLRISQAWLQTMVWQLCVVENCLSSAAVNACMTFHYPIDISGNLVSIIEGFSQKHLEVHGVGLIEKLFDIACCLADVMACTALSPSAFSEDPSSYLFRLATMISALRGGQILYQKLRTKISEYLPDLALPHPLNLPQNMPHSNINMSPGLVLSPHAGPGASNTLPSPAHPSSELIRQLAAQTGAQLPIAAYTPQQGQQVGFAGSSSRADDLGLYGSSAAHPRAHSTSSAATSSSATPNPYETTPSQSHTQLLSHPHSLGHVSPHTVQQPHSSQHTHPGHRAMQHPSLPVHPSPYDPRFNVPGYHVPPVPMPYDDDSGQHSAHGQSGLYRHQGEQSGGGGGYAGESSKSDW